jgi:ribonuclease BN (tRNA processing enzyme)
MFSQKYMKKYKLKTQGKEFNMIGVSRAAKATCFYIPELKLMLDAGYAMEYSPNIVVITHLHWDHIAEIMRVMLSSEKNKNPLILICPYQSIGYIKNLIEVSYRATKRTPFNINIKYPPHAIIGLDSSTSIILDISRKSMNIIGCKDNIFQVGNFIKYENENDNCITKMAQPMEIISIRCYHSQVTNGYGFIEHRNVMKDEYTYINENGKKCCKLSPEQITEFKNNGLIDNFMTIKHIPLFAFLCDTDHNVFNEEEPYNGKLVKTFPIIIIECTFFDDNDLKKAKKKKHMHWKNLEPYVKEYSQIQFKLIHLSDKYSINELVNFKNNIEKYNNVEILIDLPKKIKKQINKIKTNKDNNKNKKETLLYEIKCLNKIDDNLKIYEKISGKNIKDAINRLLNIIQFEILQTENPPQIIEYYLTVSQYQQYPIIKSQSEEFYIYGKLDKKHYVIQRKEICNRSVYN